MMNSATFQAVHDRVRRFRYLDRILQTAQEHQGGSSAQRVADGLHHQNPICTDQDAIT